MTRIAIIGAGTAGLTCAYILKRYGLESIIFEKENYCGGRARNIQLDDGEVPIGAIYFSKSYTSFIRLLYELGLDSGITRLKPNKVGLYFDEGLVRFTLTNVLATKALSAKLKLHLFRFSQLISKPEKIQSKKDLYSLTLADFIRESFSDQFLDRVVDPCLRAALAQSSDEVTAINGLLTLSSVLNILFLKNGIVEFHRRLSSRLKTSLVLPNPVTTVKSCSNGQLEVHHAQGQDRFDIVVCTTPIPVARSILPEVRLPSLEYSRKHLVVVEGKPQFPDLKILIDADWHKHGVNAVYSYGKYSTVTLADEQYDLKPFFRNWRVITDHYWSACGPKMPAGTTIPELRTEVDNLYICGDFFRAGGIESAVSAGKTVAEMIADSLGQIERGQTDLESK